MGTRCAWHDWDSCWKQETRESGGGAGQTGGVYAGSRQRMQGQGKGCRDKTVGEGTPGGAGASLQAVSLSYPRNQVFESVPPPVVTTHCPHNMTVIQSPNREPQRLYPWMQVLFRALHVSAVRNPILALKGPTGQPEASDSISMRFCTVSLCMFRLWGTSILRAVYVVNDFKEPKGMCIKCSGKHTQWRREHLLAREGTYPIWGNTLGL